MSLLNGLQLYFTLDETAGNCASSYGTALTGSCTNITYGTTGQVGTCYTFDSGSTSNVNFGNAGRYNEFTVSAWIKTLIGGMVISNYYSFQPQGWGLTVGNSSWDLTVRNGGSTWGASTTDVSDGEWHHILGTFKIGEPLQYYTDGQYDVSWVLDPLTGEMVYNSSDELIVGYSNGGNYGNYFDGDIDEICIWDRVLSQEEITEVYNKGLAGQTLIKDKSRYINGIDGYSGEHPTADNNSIDDTLIGWKNLQVLMKKSVNAGTTFSNPIVSTFSVLSPAWENYYFGTVLALNGDIHCVPNSAEYGQKINCYTGVVSTYSLVYTTSNAYMGGVLDSNGYIHFVPAKASVGQKISPSGVVSTYSLAFTYGDNEGYNGGVLAPNGDIHFIKYAAIDSGVGIGQKISKAGVASTYAYPDTNIHIGGVLDPKGFIHLTPYGASDRGYKINTKDNSFSTYSLLYTTSDAYQGAVLDSYGNVHFVPCSAEVGQKVNINGIVSTYSLAYTTSNASAHGVLAPNGDIIFVSSNGSNYQRIDINGIVSTFTAPYGYNIGATLTPNGDIYCFSYSSFCEKISTLPAIPFDMSICLSPFFNKR